MNNLISLKEKLEKEGIGSRNISVSIEDDALIISDLDLPEFKIYTILEDEIMKLWIPIASINEFSESQRINLNENLLQSNGMLPLSNFGIFGDMYCLSGDLSSSSTFDNIVLELNTLFNNIVEAVEGVFVPAFKES